MDISIEIDDYKKKSIEIEPKITSNLKNKLVKSLSLTVWCCIFEVPNKLRKTKESLFRPSLVSIGPYHHNETKQLRLMEDIKMWYLNCLLDRSPTPDNLLELLMRSVGADVNFHRECYAEKEKLPKNDKEFVEMLVVDGCFIIEYFRKHKNVVELRDNDPIFERSWMRKTLVVDLLLLENQVPWSVLDVLYETTQVTVESKWQNLSLAQLSHNSIHLHTFRKTPIPDLDISRFYPIRHLLDLHRSIILYSDKNEQVLPAGDNKKIKGLIRNISLELGHMKKSSQRPPSVLTMVHIKKETIDNPSRGLAGGSVPIVSSEVKGIPEPPPPPPPPPPKFLQPKPNPPLPPLKPVHSGSNPMPKRNQEKKKPKFSLTVFKKRSDLEKHPAKQKRYVYTPCIKVLLQAGVSFQVQKVVNLMDIGFENGVLKIPPLHLMDNAEILLRNLIAYEQCDRDLGDKITSFAGFLDNLIDSSSDIETLRDADIVSSHLSPEDVSGFFSGLYNNVHVVHYTLWDVAQDINKYCKNTIPKWRVILRRDYFSNPWSGISVIAAIIILALTFVQTYYAVTNN